MLGTNQWLFIDGHAVENLSHPPANPSQVWKNVASEVQYAQQMDQQSTPQQSLNWNLILLIIIGILVIALIAVSVYAVTK